MSTSAASRRSLLVSGGAAALGIGLLGAGSGSAQAAVSRSAAVTTPQAALERLLRGNRRFITGHARHPDQTVTHLHEIASGQHPFVTTIGCADSRVSPEILFDEGLGDIFDNRVAGNLVDDLLLGSVEFAVEEFATPLILVLGHERCGAISAAVEALESGSTPAGHIGTIVEALRPVVEPLLGTSADPAETIEAAVRANVRAQVQALTEQSSLIAERVAKGEVRVLGARYDLDNGKVTLVH
ncbi:carbonic anhydrase [Kineosporia sp. NBRC 101731]|uniref:carbonic anhydrase n=1 Tax=Kineosporia sp. NBRC 101731 TaxID=3032199 RepID=UPI0024A523B7|nr:carbonic anhydrase [Kineosporia sp. NBRC 101731]GLY32538.1 carbonic anhydrase [Kineosporia sp. NBRC 101731]